MTVLGTARSVSSSRTHCALFHETREEEVRRESPHRFLPTQSYSSVGQSATLIMWRSAVQVCLGLLLSFSGGLAQLARAPALHAGGQRFESVILHSFYCSVAMMITHQSIMTEHEIFDILNTQQVDSCFHPSQDEMRIQRIIQVTKQR